MNYIELNYLNCEKNFRVYPYGLISKYKEFKLLLLNYSIVIFLIIDN